MNRPLASLLGLVVFFSTNCARGADIDNAASVQSLSPNNAFKLNLNVGEISVESGDEVQIIHPSEGDSFAAESGELAKVEWSSDSEFFLISGSAGSHGQYSVQHLYRLQKMSVKRLKAWSFAEVTILSRLGTFAALDPDYGGGKWGVASKAFSRTGILVDLWPIGHNSNPFDFSAEYHYEVAVEPRPNGFKVQSLTRVIGELGSRRILVWKSDP